MKFLVQASGLPSLTAPKIFEDSDPLSKIGNWPRQGHEPLKTGNTFETLDNCSRMCQNSKCSVLEFYNL